jgi:hypothetical protein
MITAYMDESGTHQGSKVLVIAAYVGDSETWGLVETCFKQAEEKAGRIFHAVDCAQGGKNFRGVAKDDRFQLTMRMVEIVNTHDLFGIAWGGIVDDYAEFHHREEGVRWEDWLGGLFSLVFTGVINDVAKYVRQKYPGEKFSVVMEDSEHWYARAAEKFIRGKHDPRFADHSLLGTIAPFSKDEAVQLHAADLLAYEAYLMKLREHYPTKHGPREPLLALLKKQKWGRVFDRAAFLEIHEALAAGKIPFDAQYSRPWTRPPRKRKKSY